MAVFSPKHRLISFRLSQSEYETLRAMASSDGAHSLSDFVRDCMCRVIRNRGAREKGIVGLDRVTGARSMPVEERNFNLNTDPSASATEIRILIEEIVALHKKTELLDGIVRELTLRLRLASASHDSGEEGNGKESRDRVELPLKISL